MEPPVLPSEGMRLKGVGVHGALRKNKGELPSLVPDYGVKKSRLLRRCSLLLTRSCLDEMWTCRVLPSSMTSSWRFSMALMACHHGIVESEKLLEQLLTSRRF